MENILELQRVSKTFPKSNFTLENVTFSLPYGAILGFVGENGAGKTTTIGCILNTMIEDSGTIKLFGGDIMNPEAILAIDTPPIDEGVVCDISNHKTQSKYYSIINSFE